MRPTKIERNISLAPYTTLKVGGIAEYFVDVHDIDTLRSTTKWARENEKPITVLGGGSNVLLCEDVTKGVVLRVALASVIYSYEGDDVYVTAGAGTVLDELIAELVSKNIWGMENLSAIPGYVGATPIQNVGAYGVEVSDLITAVVAYDPEKDQFLILNNQACRFEYRDSLFKHEEARDLVVVWVVYKLSKVPSPKLSYNDVERYFKGKADPSLGEIREAIIAIRSKKFPDLLVVGTAGSFFKNPILSLEAFKKLRGKFPTLPGFVLSDGNIKIPLGYVLDKILGLKGYREGSVGLYEEQALVLVNHGGAHARDIENFAQKIRARIKEKTDIDVEYEVSFIAQ